jgi:hypothetical protein
MAKSELEAGQEVSSVEKIVLGREFYHASWILEGYKELVQKFDTITDDEAINIQLLTAIKLFRIREIMQRQSLTSALRAVEGVFSEELSAIREEEIKYSTEQEKALVKEDEMRRRESEEHQVLLLTIAQAEEEERRGEVSSNFNPFGFGATSSPFASIWPEPAPAFPRPPSPPAPAASRKNKRR